MPTLLAREAIVVWLFFCDVMFWLIRRPLLGQQWETVLIDPSATQVKSAAVGAETTDC